MSGKGKENWNMSDVSQESRIRTLALMDWAHQPTAKIQAVLAEVGIATIYQYRNSELYKSIISELREEWEAQMKRLPQTVELRKSISHAMSLSVNRLIEILANDRAATKDVISAARLTAQIDGRFLHAGGDGDSASNPEQESIAAELLTALNRQKQTIQ